MIALIGVFVHKQFSLIFVPYILFHLGFVTRKWMPFRMRIVNRINHLVSLTLYTLKIKSVLTSICSSVQESNVIDFILLIWVPSLL